MYRQSKLNSVLKNSKGFTIIEGIVSAFVMGVVAVALVNTSNTINKGQSDNTSRVSIANFNRAASNLLITDSEACTNTLQGMAANTGNQVIAAGILDQNNTPVFTACNAAGPFVATCVLGSEGAADLRGKAQITGISLQNVATAADIDSAEGYNYQGQATVLVEIQKSNLVAEGAEAAGNSGYTITQLFAYKVNVVVDSGNILRCSGEAEFYYAGACDQLGNSRLNEIGPLGDADVDPARCEAPLFANHSTGTILVRPATVGGDDNDPDDYAITSIDGLNVSRTDAEAVTTVHGNVLIGATLATAATVYDDMDSTTALSPVGANGGASPGGNLFVLEDTVTDFMRIGNATDPSPNSAELHIETGLYIGNHLNANFSAGATFGSPAETPDVIVSNDAIAGEMFMTNEAAKRTATDPADQTLAATVGYIKERIGNQVAQDASDLSTLIANILSSSNPSAAQSLANHFMNGFTINMSSGGGISRTHTPSNSTIHFDITYEQFNCQVDQGETTSGCPNIYGGTIYIGGSSRNGWTPCSGGWGCP